MPNDQNPLITKVEEDDDPEKLVGDWADDNFEEEYDGGEGELSGVPGTES